MLELGLLGRGRRAGQRLEAAVDLKRVRRDRDRVLAALAQQAGERQGDGGLPHSGWAEQCNHLHGR